MIQPVQSWRVDLTGTETLRNRRVEQVGDTLVKVYGTAHINYALSADVTLRRINNVWRYGGGRITRATITGYDGKYEPANVHKVKRVDCSDTASVSRMAGRAIGGDVIEERFLRLFWPMPKCWKEPAVVMVIDQNGQEAEACFVSDHFLDYASEFELLLRPGRVPKHHGFEGVVDQASTDYTFVLTQRS
jgi:hypothetical protein